MKKFLFWTLGILAVFVLAAAFIVGERTRRARKAFEARVEQLRKEGKPTSSLDLRPEPIPSEENAAPVLKALFSWVAANAT